MIAGAVALGLFAVVALAVALVERSIERARRRQREWELLVARVRPAFVAAAAVMPMLGVSMAQAAKAAADFTDAMRRCEETFAMPVVDRARLLQIRDVGSS